MSLLDSIRAAKKKEVALLSSAGSRRALEKKVEGSKPPVDVWTFLRRGEKSVIAEIKRASPSKGLIDAGLEPSATASEYVEGGAAAISVLTDAEFFHGSADDLRTVRQAVRVPILRKDFLLDELQILESRSMGADIVLLIVRLLTDGQLVRLREVAMEIGMQALLEAHTSDEVRRAVDAGAVCIGVNNRDLDTFEVSRHVSLDLREEIPAGVYAVSESGVIQPQDAHELFSAGYDAVLIGEELVKARDKRTFIRDVRGD